VVWVLGTYLRSVVTKVWFWVRVVLVMAVYTFAKGAVVDACLKTSRVLRASG